MEDIIEVTVGNYFHGIQTDFKDNFYKMPILFFQFVLFKL